MWNRKKFEDRALKENFYIRYWGSYGPDVVTELERKLQFTFPPDVRSFIQEIGNLELSGYTILITGKDCNYNCITETEDVGLFQEGKPAHGVKILDNAGLSYILYHDGSVKAYEHSYIQPDGIVFSYDSFNDLIEAFIKRKT